MEGGLDRHLRAVLDELAEAVTVLDSSGRRIYANAAAARFLGLPSSDALVGAGPDALTATYRLLDEDGEPFELARMPGRLLLAGRPTEPALIQHVHRRTGERRWVLVKASPIHDADGRVLYAVSVAEDVTEIKRNERDQRMLADASKLIASSLDLDTTLEKVAWALVPELADLCLVHLFDDAGRLINLAVASPEHGQIAELRDLGLRHPPGPGDEVGQGAVLRTGHPECHTEFTDDALRRYAFSEEQYERLRRLGYRSRMIVPLAGRGRVIGTVTVVTTAASGRRLDEQDLAVVEELGRRGGAAVENARAHAERSHVAATLQRSLLPPRLPVIPGVTLAARFRAAGEASDVGGDFYDLFPVGDGTWMVIMGDVTGKGPAAAAITGLARYTMRTAAAYEHSPRQVLQRLNDTLLSEPEERRICTAVCARVEPRGAKVRVTVACAGHPPPLALVGDRPEPVGRPGTLLGAFADGRWVDTVVDLKGGQGLVFYTDGVTDAGRGESRFGLPRLVRTLEQLSDADAEELAGRLDEEVRRFQGGPQRDDIAVLVLRATPPPATASVVATGSAPETASGLGG